MRRSTHCQATVETSIGLNFSSQGRANTYRHTHVSTRFLTRHPTDCPRVTLWIKNNARDDVTSVTKCESRPIIVVDRSVSAMVGGYSRFLEKLFEGPAHNNTKTFPNLSTHNARHWELILRACARACTCTWVCVGGAWSSSVWRAGGRKGGGGTVECHVGGEGLERRTRKVSSFTKKKVFQKVKVVKVPFLNHYILPVHHIRTHHTVFINSGSLHT